jgi:hypothetical protein
MVLTRSGQSILLKVQQLVGVVGDAKEPLVQVLLDHRRAAALAVPVLAPHLLAGQGGVAVGAEIDRRLCL